MPERLEGQGPTLSIALHRDLFLGGWFVTRVDLEIDNIKNQTRFKAPVPLQQALAQKFIELINHILPNQPHPNVHVDDEAQFDLPGLRLSGVRIVAQKVFDGVQNVVIRFQEACGAIQNLYAPDCQIETLAGAPSQDHRALRG